MPAGQDGVLHVLVLEGLAEPGHLQLVLLGCDGVGEVDGEHEGEVDDRGRLIAGRADGGAIAAPKNAASARRNEVVRCFIPWLLRLGCRRAARFGIP